MFTRHPGERGKAGECSVKQHGVSPGRRGGGVSEVPPSASSQPPFLPHTPVEPLMGRLTSAAIRAALGDLMAGVIAEAALTSVMPVVSHN